MRMKVRFDGGCISFAGRTVDDAQCIHREDHVNENETSTVTNMECFQWATPVLLGIYLLIANVLLLNLLIAIFRYVAIILISALTLEIPRVQGKGINLTLLGFFQFFQNPWKFFGKN